MEIDFKMRIKLRQHQKAGEQEENPERFVHQMLKALYVDPQGGDVQDGDVQGGDGQLVVILNMVLLKTVILNWW